MVSTWWVHLDAWRVQLYASSAASEKMSTLVQDRCNQVQMPCHAMHGQQKAPALAGACCRDCWFA